VQDNIQSIVREQYGRSATAGLSSDNDGVRAVAEAFGYTPAELNAIPAEANMGLSCGNPTATAHLKPGEVVVDLGSGGGLDVFLAAQKVGPAGRAIGIDMTPQMIDLARRNAAKAGLANVEFHLAPIDRLPLPDASADVVISNCVINLAPDKPAVFREMFRVLKPGGRVAVSDIALKQDLPPDLARDVMAYVGCIAGAIRTDAFGDALRAAGFDAVHVVDTGADLNAYAGVDGQSACCTAPAAEKPKPAPLAVAEPACCGPTCCAPPAPAAVAAAAPGVHNGLATLLARHNINDYAASVKVYAIKPA